ncbi:MAG: HAD family phosphatase [Kosmotoga sp.]|nr:MAG: HAD family phosphatase [Kosmotoga sp.]
MIKAVVFDMDGVMIDSEWIYKKACQNILKKYGKEATEELFQAQMGRSMEEAQQIIVEMTGLHVEPEKIGKEYINEYLRLSEELLKPNPGLYNLINFLKSKVSLAVASSTQQNVVEKILERFGIKKVFSAITGGDKVKRSKPYPEIYTMTSRKLGVLPANCIVIEDSPAGIESAKKAGMTVFALETEHNSNMDISYADSQFDSLREIHDYLLEML